MYKNTRLLFLFILLPSAFVIAKLVTGDFIPTGAPGQWFFSGILLLILGSFFLEQHFVKPSDVIANSIQILTVLLIVYNDTTQLLWTHRFWWALFTYSLFLLFSASLSLLLVDANRSESSRLNIIAKILKNISLTLGRAEVIYSIVFLSSILFYFETSSVRFIVLVIYWAFIILLRPIGLIDFIDRIINKKNLTIRNIGKVLYSETENLVNLEIFKDVQLIVGQGIVTRKRDGLIYKGVVYNLNVMYDKTIAKIFLNKSPSPELENEIIVKNEFVIETSTQSEVTNSVIGIVADSSDISVLRFYVYPECKLKEGNIVKSIIYDTTVYYQIINALDKEENLTGQNTYGKTLAIAKQIGEWIESETCFETFGWVPPLNNPVFLVTEDEEVNYSVKENEYSIGTLPNTNFPVIANIDSLVTHHTAIIGITGSGKTRTSRRMAAEIIKTGRKVICVDFTGEYMSLFSSLSPNKIVSDENNKKLNESLKLIHIELEKWEDKRVKAIIEKNEGIIQDIFNQVIKDFIETPDVSLGIFELPEILNTKAALDYTKYFFKVLFKMAKEKKIGQGLAIILEEAHTIVPESNFLGTDDKLSKSVMNSIGQIALQGRKHGIGFIVITQRTANVSKTILTQCNSIICFRIYDNTGLEFLSNYVGKEMVQAIPNLSIKKGNREAIVIGKAFNSKNPVITRIPEEE